MDPVAVAVVVAHAVMAATITDLLQYASFLARGLG